jgi:type VI secretion system secreted protein VgrG
VAGQDINFASQGGAFHTVEAGISLFTYGKASNKEKPNQETGIKFHAASGKVSSQSQSAETRITADKQVTVASITKSVTIAAKVHALLTAQGAYLKIEGGNIMLHGPGKIEFKASMKELAGPVSVASPATAGKLHELNIKRDLEIEYVDAEGNALKNEPIDLNFLNADTKKVHLDGSGKATLKKAPFGPFRSHQPNRK